jgi:hypothetical protein
MRCFLGQQLFRIYENGEIANVASGDVISSKKGEEDYTKANAILCLAGSSGSSWQGYDAVSVGDNRFLLKNGRNECGLEYN